MNYLLTLDTNIVEDIIKPYVINKRNETAATTIQKYFRRYSVLYPSYPDDGEYIFVQENEIEIMDSVALGYRAMMIINSQVPSPWSFRGLREALKNWHPFGLRGVLGVYVDFKNWRLREYPNY